MRLTQWLLLCLLFTSYLMLGGLIFMNLERDNEVKARMRLNTFRREIKVVLLEMDHQFYQNDTSQETLNQIRVAKETVLRRLSVLTGQNIFWDSATATPNSNKSQWDFYNSVFYGFSIVTTIGYGHMTPTTNLARCAAILFGLIGIPLNGILLSSIGDYFSGKLMKVQVESKELTIANVIKISFQLMVGSLFFILMPAVLFSVMEKWSYVESIYFTCISLMTIGFGDFVPGKRVENNFFVWTYKILIILWIELGLAYLVVILAFVTKILVNEKLRSTIERQLQTINSTKDQLLKDLEDMRLAIDTHVSLPGGGGGNKSLGGSSMSSGGTFQKIAQTTGGFASGQIIKAVGTVKQVVKAVGSMGSGVVMDLQNDAKSINASPQFKRMLSAHPEIHSEVSDEAPKNTDPTSSSSLKNVESRLGSETSSEIFIIHKANGAHAGAGETNGPTNFVSQTTPTSRASTSAGSQKTKIFYQSVMRPSMPGVSADTNSRVNHNQRRSSTSLTSAQEKSGQRTITVDGTFNLSISSRRVNPTGHHDMMGSSQNDSLQNFSAISSNDQSYALDKIVAQIRLDREQDES